MKGTVAVLAGPAKLECREYEVTDPEPGIILCEVVQANVCGSELHIWLGNHPTVRFGSVMGHEMLLRVLKLGAGVTTDFAGKPLQRGDRIVATYFLICRRCPPCQAGEWNSCENAYNFWALPADEPPHFHAAFATHYYIHPDQYVYKVPAGVADGPAASANCALSQMLFAVDRAGVRADDVVLIQGAGGLGLCGIAACKVRGAHVIAIDGVPLRLQQAHDFGADDVIDLREYPTFADRQARVRALAGKAGPDVAFDVTGIPATFEEGWQLVRPGGRLIEIGNISPGRKTEVDVGLLTRRNVHIQGILRYDPWYLRLAMEFLERYVERFPFDKLIDAVYPLREVEKAIRDSTERKVTRASLVMGLG